MASVQNLQRRYIKRAAWLINQADFTNMVYEARSKWDADFPSYAIVAPRNAPRLSEDIGHFVYPARMETQLEHLTNGLLTEEEANVLFWSATEWEERSEDIAKKAFDRDFFPSYEMFGKPAARFFISYCMVYQPRTIPLAHFFRQEVRYRVITDSSSSNQWLMASQAELKVLRGEIERVFQDDPEELLRVTEKANAAYREAFSIASHKRFSLALGDWDARVVLPVPSAATQQEILRAAEEAVVASHRNDALKGYLSFDEQVIRYHCAGVEPEKIATYAGVDSSYIRRITSSYRKRATNS